MVRQQFPTWPLAASSCILPACGGGGGARRGGLPLPACRDRAGVRGVAERVHGNRLRRFLEPSLRLGHRSTSAAQACGCWPKALPWARAPRRARWRGAGTRPIPALLDPGIAASPTPDHPYLELLHSSDSRSACWGTLCVRSPPVIAPPPQRSTPPSLGGTLPSRECCLLGCRVGAECASRYTETVPSRGGGPPEMMPHVPPYMV